MGKLKSKEQQHCTYSLPQVHFGGGGNASYASPQHSPVHCIKINIFLHIIYYTFRYKYRYNKLRITKHFFHFEYILKKTKLQISY